MANISDELMDHTWKKVGSGQPHQLQAMQKKHQRDQKALTKFAYRHLMELPVDAAGVGLYVFHVILEAFFALSPRPRAVRRSAIDLTWKLPAEVLAENVRTKEPYAAQYLEDALTEGDEVDLTESERALCSHVIQVAILNLHGACENRR
ncbi:MAG: hypothetical protein ACNA7J_08905 [Wenzhouxiangella sp.]